MLNSTKLIPEAVERIGEWLHEAEVIGHDHVLLVVAGRASGPVVASGDESLAVENCELVMHVEMAPINAHRNARGLETFDVGAKIRRLRVVRHDSDGNVAPMGARIASESRSSVIVKTQMLAVRRE